MAKKKYSTAKNISLTEFIEQRKAIENPNEQSLFDFLFTTGARISEVLPITPEDINQNDLSVGLRTLKNPIDRYRTVVFFPQEPTLLQSILETTANTKPTKRIWNFTRQRAWTLCKRYFNCKDHSFRHSNAILCAKPPVNMNAPELKARFGWARLASAENYLKWNYAESMAQKMELKTPTELGLV